AIGGAGTLERRAVEKYIATHRGKNSESEKTTPRICADANDQKQVPAEAEAKEPTLLWNRHCCRCSLPSEGCFGPGKSAWATRVWSFSAPSSVVPSGAQKVGL